jgi:hypothetical protein
MIVVTGGASLNRNWDSSWGLKTPFGRHANLLEVVMLLEQLLLRA